MLRLSFETQKIKENYAILVLNNLFCAFSYITAYTIKIWKDII